MPATRVDDEEDGAVTTGKGRKRPASLEDFPVMSGGTTGGQSEMGVDQASLVRDKLRELDLEDVADLERDELRIRSEQRVEKARLNLIELQKKRRRAETGSDEPSGMFSDQGAPQPGGEGTDPADAQIAQDVAEMDEPKQRAFFDAYSKMQMLKNPNSMAMFLPGLLGTARASETSPNDVTKVGEAMVNAMKTGMEMTRKNGGGDSDLASVVLKLIDKLESRNESNPSTTLLQTIEGLSKAGLVYTRKDIIEMQKEDNQWRAKGGMGDLSPGHIELERLRMDQQVKLEEIRNSTQMELAKLGIETKRTDAIANAGERLIGTIGRTLADAEADELDERGYGSSSAPALAGFTPSKPAGATAAADIEEVKCPNPACGKTITVPEPEKSRDLVCIHCNTPLHWSSVTK